MAMAQPSSRKRSGSPGLAVEETGHGNIPDKRIKNLFNSLHVAEWLRNVRTLGVLCVTRRRRSSPSANRWESWRR